MIIILLLPHFIIIDECFTQANEKCLFQSNPVRPFNNLSICYWDQNKKGFLCPTKLHEDGTIFQEGFCQTTCQRECDRDTWLCDDKCISTQDSCNGTCFSDGYVMTLCGKKCYNEEGLKKSR